MVQVGNEITPGMLVHVPDADTDCWGNGAAPRTGGVTGSSSNANWGNLIMRDLPNRRGLGSFFWEPTEGGDWGQSMFTCESGVCRANAADFQVFDQIRVDFGL